jgi:hypothetical protein
VVPVGDVKLPPATPLWSTLIQYLSMLDHTIPQYHGAGACLGKHNFAHGGSGFVMSRSAMAQVVEHYSTHKAEIEKFIDLERAGDYVLSKQLEAVDIHFQSAFPHFQGDYPGLLPYANSDERGQKGTRKWCFPTISYHKMSSDMIRGLWDFDQKWLVANGNVSILNDI